MQCHHSDEANAISRRGIGHGTPVPITELLSPVCNIEILDATELISVVGY